LSSFEQGKLGDLIVALRGTAERQTMNNDLVYLNRRACEERAAALDCRHLAVRDIHLELAQAYEFRVFLLNQMTAIQTSSSQLSVEEYPAEGEPGEAFAAGRPAKVDRAQKTLMI
jgi:hypothetical protein